MSKYTPGEWAIDDSPESAEDRAAAGIYYIINKEKRIVAETMSVDAAHLIATAPDLLEACNNALDALHDHDPDKAIDLLCAVIDRAEGRE